MLISMMLITIVGCSGSSTRSINHVQTRSNSESQIIAIINGSPISRDQIQDDLGERAGQLAILDLALDRQLDRELHNRQIQISQSDLDKEESIYISSISDGDSRSIGYEMLDAVRSSMGLGPDRYPRMIRRNAILRKLIGEAGSPSENEYLLAEQIAFGPRFRVRLFVSDSEQFATELRHRVIGSQDESKRWIFADACAENSIHPSSNRGGLITELSLADIGYPSVILDAIRAGTPGQISSVLATDAGYALVLVESAIQAAKPTPEQMRSVRDQLAYRKQRLEMQRLADDLLKNVEVTILDRALNWAWITRP